MYPTVHLLELQRHYIPQRDRVLGTSCLGDDFVLHQAIYEEIRQQFPNDSSRQRSYYTPLQQGSAVYIFAGFKIMDSTFQDVMEDTWKDWTGARSLYINLADDFGLHRFSLYRRVCPTTDFATFMYILLVECRTVTHRNSLRLLDFVSRFRVQRMTGYLSVYSTEKLGSTSHEPSGDILLGRRSRQSNGDWWKQVEETAAASSEVSESSSSDDAPSQERGTSNEDGEEDDEVFAERVTPTSTPSPTLVDDYYAQRRKNGYLMMPIYENHVEDEVDLALLSKSSATTYCRRKHAGSNGQTSPSVAGQTFKNAHSSSLISPEDRCANGYTADLTIQDDLDRGHWTTVQDSVRASDPGYYTLDEAITLAATRSNDSALTNGEKSHSSVLKKQLDIKARELLELDEMLQNLQCVT